MEITTYETTFGPHCDFLVTIGGMYLCPVGIMRAFLMRGCRQIGPLENVGAANLAPAYLGPWKILRGKSGAWNVGPPKSQTHTTKLI